MLAGHYVRQRRYAFQHPTQALLDRLSGCGAKVCLTRDCGAITLTLRNGAWRVQTFLEATP